MSTDDDMSILSMLERGTIDVTARFFFRRKAERKAQEFEKNKNILSIRFAIVPIDYQIKAFEHWSLLPSAWDKEAFGQTGRRVGASVQPKNERNMEETLKT